MSDIPNQRQAENPPATSPAPAVTPPAAEQNAPLAADVGAGERSIFKARKAPAKVQSLPPFRVVLHDDEHVEMTYVVRSIVELTPLSAPMARDAMLSAHEHGQAALLVTHQERAELYQEQFTSKGLTVTIERAA
jgi:ATP-dependent Clp protease adaptor protein ClpS